LRILIVTPRQPLATGNHITAQRYRDYLMRRGHEVRLTATDEEDSASLRHALCSFRPDLVHLLHAYRSGLPWLSCCVEPRPPFVVTLTGTDIHHGISTPEEGNVIREILKLAAAVISQNRLTADALQKQPTEWADRVRYLPPGIVLGDAPYPLRRLHEIASDARLFLHPAGIRPVKGNLELLRLFDPVAAARPGCRLAFCGPELDSAYAERFLAEVAIRPWALYLHVIPTPAMPAALAEADVVLNHSLNEGLPNTLIEAAALGRPILARDIPGNAAVVEPGVNGLLYRTDDEFIRHALTLIDDPVLRRKLSRPQPDAYAPAAEAEALEAIYREVLETTSCTLPPAPPIEGRGALVPSPLEGED
jgi:glycosyltransferase involved in cell wall biosynthesis